MCSYLVFRCWHDSYVKRTHVYLWHDSFSTHSCVWQCSSIRVTWCIHMLIWFIHAWDMTHSRGMQQTATHCNTLQHMQHTATHCCNTLQHAATHCNTLQHTATHCCNTLLGIQLPEYLELDIQLTSFWQHSSHRKKDPYAQERRESRETRNTERISSSILFLVCFLLLSWAEIANTIANTTVKNNITYRPTEFLGFANMVVEKNKSTSWIESWVEGSKFRGLAVLIRNRQYYR